MPELTGVETRIRLSPTLAVPTITVAAPLTTFRAALCRPSRGIATVCGGTRCAPEQPTRATTLAHTATRHAFMHGTLPHNPAAMHEPSLAAPPRLPAPQRAKNAGSAV